MASQFGRILAEHMRRGSWSQSSLAAASGYSNAFVSKLVRGERLPSWKAADALCRALALTGGERAQMMKASGHTLIPADQFGPEERVGFVVKCIEVIPDTRGMRAEFMGPWAEEVEPGTWFMENDNPPASFITLRYQPLDRWKVDAIYSFDVDLEAIKEMPTA